MVWADTAARSLMPGGRELPVGIEVDGRERGPEAAAGKGCRHLIPRGEWRVEMARGAESRPLGPFGAQIPALGFQAVPRPLKLADGLLQAADGPLQTPDKTELPEEVGDGIHLPSSIQAISTAPPSRFGSVRLHCLRAPKSSGAGRRAIQRWANRTCAHISILPARRINPNDDCAKIAPTAGNPRVGFTGAGPLSHAGGRLWLRCPRGFKFRAKNDRRGLRRAISGNIDHGNPPQWTSMTSTTAIPTGRP